MLVTFSAIRASAPINASEPTIPKDEPKAFHDLPSVDAVVNHPAAAELREAFGPTAMTQAVRDQIADLRATIAAGQDPGDALGTDTIVEAAAEALVARFAPSLRPVLNLTGTVIHTNLGRAVLPAAALDAMADAARGPVNLEFDLDKGRRGDRDDHLEAQIRRLTGAEAATVVNNNAAAVLLLLNTLANRKQVIVSRGELVEIGGAFRIPDVMARAGAKLREVGTTNRTHAKDFESAIEPRTALIMKVHTSNYEVQGFTKVVPERELAAIAKAHDLPFAVDLGSGMLIDLEAYGLPHEPTVRETLEAGADLVTFSGDKLLGGPQAGIIAGRADLIAKIKKNPMKRALRVDKIIIAALSATLRLYETPETLAEHLPVLRHLTRPLDDIEALAAHLIGPLTAALDGLASVSTQPVKSQIGSGALPIDLLPSVALAITPAGRRKGGAVNTLAAAFRRLPVPVVGRVADGALLFDLRCLDDAGALIGQLGALDLSEVT